MAKKEWTRRIVNDSAINALHYAIIKGNKNIVHNLIYYGKKG